MPERVAYVYSVREPPGATRPSQYCTYLRHMVVDGQHITVQVCGGGRGGMEGPSLGYSGGGQCTQQATHACLPAHAPTHLPTNEWTHRTPALFHPASLPSPHSLTHSLPSPLPSPLPPCLCVVLQVSKFIPRGVVLQYLGAQRELYLESPAAAALAQYMPSHKASESSRVVRSPMTGHLVEVRVCLQLCMAVVCVACVSSLNMQAGKQQARRGVEGGGWGLGTPLEGGMCWCVGV